MVVARFLLFVFIISLLIWFIISAIIWYFAPESKYVAFKFILNKATRGKATNKKMNKDLEDYKNER